MAQSVTVLTINRPNLLITLLR